MEQFQYFNDSSVLTKFIKAIVNTTNLPLIDYWKPGKPIKRGIFYITDNYIVKCIKDSDGSNVKTIYDTEYFDVISPYVFGENYRCFTGTFQSKYQWYDAETHKYLGKYLRMLRDFKQINLMHLYNCVTPVEYNSIRIKTTVDVSDETQNVFGHPYMHVELDTKFDGDDGYKVITCPIMYDQDYTIYANSSLPVKMTAIYFNGINSIFEEPVSDSFMYKQSMTFSNPILYKCKQSTTQSSLDSVYRNLLTLIIQVPKNCNNIVVLEGDYTKLHIINTPEGNKLTQTIIGNNHNLDTLSNVEMDKLCPAISNLTKTLQNKLHAFDLELIPYLLYHVIEPNDEISENIAVIQEYISSADFNRLYGMCYTKPFKRGIWDNNLRKFIYDVMLHGIKRDGNILINQKIFNNTGYIDRDTEEAIKRGHYGL